MSDLSRHELETIIHNAFAHKQAAKSGKSHLARALQSKTVALMMAKRSTRTRVSTEAAVAAMGGHPMFLGQSDIQLGVNTCCLNRCIFESHNNSYRAHIGQ